MRLTRKKTKERNLRMYRTRIPLVTASLLAVSMAGAQSFSDNFRSGYRLITYFEDSGGLLVKGWQS